MALRVQIDSYRGLTRCDWTLEPGVSLLVGPNGSGKTTLLAVPLLLRHAVEVGTRSAVDRHGGPGQIVNLRATNAERARIEVSEGDLAWRLHLAPRGGDLGISNWITQGDKQLVEKKSSSVISNAFPYDTYDTPTLKLSGAFSNVLAPRIELADPGNEPSPEMKIVAEQQPAAVQNLIGRLQHYDLFGGYWVRSLRILGSKASSDLTLEQDGTNAFSVLRNWMGARATRARWDFVMTGLRAAFPDIFEELEFEAAGQTVAARIFAPRMQASIGAYFAPDGLLTGLLHLTAVASVPDGGALAIDEFENSLHPYAIRALLEHIRGWANDHSVSVTLASHSPVLIDQFKQEPSRILVMDPATEVLPVPIDRLRDPEWLAHFSLGDLYAGGEFGAQAPH